MLTVHFAVWDFSFPFRIEHSSEKIIFFLIMQNSTKKHVNGSDFHLDSAKLLLYLRCRVSMGLETKNGV